MRILIIWVICMIEYIRANNIMTPDLILLTHLDQKKLYLDCITNDINAAVSWKTPIEASYLPVLYKAQQNTSSAIIIKNLPPTKWVNEELSFSRNYGPILDRRWEEFETKYTNGNNPLEFVNLAYINLQSDFEIAISIRLKKEGHIYLCKRFSTYYPYPIDGECYWVILGGFKGEASVIRKCKSGTIPRTNISPSDRECKIDRDKVNINPLKENEWTHVTLKLKHNIFSVNILGLDEPFMSYNNEYADELQYTDVYVHSRSSVAGFWKIHKYTYNKGISEEMGILLHLTTLSFTCISMYISLCKTCMLTLQLECQNIIYDEMQYSTLDENWKKIIFQPKVPHIDASCNVNYRTHSDDGDSSKYFWAISKIEECYEHDLKISRISLLTRNNKGNIECQFLNNKKSIELPAVKSKWRDVQERNCTIAEFGRSCYSCGMVSENSNYCEETLICDLNENDKQQCYCSAGYTGLYCKKECTVGSYGFMCKENCGKCNNSQCDHITGFCTSGCEHNYNGDLCKEINYPIIKEVPTANESCFRKCQLSVHTNDYLGSQRPVTYKIKYKKSTEYNWMYTDSIPIGTMDVFLKDLHLSTRYDVKVILYTEDGGSFDDNKKDMEFITKCLELQSTDVIVKPTNISVEILVKASNDTCDISQYHAELNLRKYYWTTSGLVIENLVPNMEYQLNIININSYELLIHFKTQEGVPSAVENLDGFNLKDNSLKIIWSEPKDKNGVIQSYTVYYKHIKYISCDTKSKNRETIIITSTSNGAELTNLEPYSKYSIKVSARTLNYEGPVAEIYVDTQSTDKPTENEAKVREVIAFSSSAKIEFEYFCEKLQGPIYFSLSANCKHKWCKQSQTLNEEVSSIVNVNGLYPYSDYELDIKVSRGVNEGYKLQLPKLVFKTKETQPNRITNLDFYSTNSNSISLRWIEPYPPNGEIEIYKISYIEKRIFSDASSSRNINPHIKCNIWTNMLCYTIPELNRGYEYTISVSVKNKNVKSYSYDTIIKATALEKEPEAPLNLVSWFDEYHNMTLQWEHPTRMNGAITSFFIKVNKAEEYHKISQYNLTYTHEVKLVIPTSMKINVGVSAINKAGKSQFSYIYVQTPPKIPEFDEVPYIVEETNNSITFNVGTNKYNNSQSRMYVLVADSIMGRSNVKSQPILDLLHMTNISDNVLEFAEINMNKKKIFIGNNSDDLNIILDPGTTYKIHFLLVNTYDKYKRHKLYTLDVNTGGNKEGMASSSVNSAVYAILLLLLLVPLLVYIVIKRRRGLKFISPFRNQSNDNIPLTSNIKHTATLPSTITKTILKPEITNRIKISDFEKYVKEAISNGELEKQHELFPKGGIRPSNYGSLPQNKPKNRYANLVAYDHSRVPLPKLNDDPFSDYINANYIMGFDGKVNYIATQGPKVATVNDFWRMVWHENTTCIIMLANVIENGKKKTEQYWPNINEEIVYGDISVEYYSSEIFADYEYRVFIVEHEMQTRKVTQLHFTSWPDHGIPLYPQSLVPFLRKMLTIPHEKSPMIVHCSAGIGRTGTIILIDICLRLAAREGFVDVMYHQQQLREQRTNMVDNVQQYKLVHLVLLECLIAPHTAIPCNDNFEEEMTHVLKHEINTQMTYIENSAWQDNAMDSRLDISANLIVEYPEKNRFHAIVPQQYGKIILPRYPLDDESSTYINAVTVDGFNARNRFIVTQDPLPGTVGDFWRLLHAKESHVIISLNAIDVNDQTCCEFWPNENRKNVQPIPVISLKYHNTNSSKYYNLITVKFEYEEEHRDVSIISVKNWNFGNECPSEASLLSVWHEMNRLSRSEHQIIVTCRDGKTSCGLYVAMCFILEKIKLEQLCDVCLATRVIRRSRKEFLSEEQFKLLYKIANLYLSEFEIYSNFCSK